MKRVKTEHFENTQFGPMSTGHTITEESCSDCDQLRAELANRVPRSRLEAMEIEIKDAENKAKSVYKNAVAEIVRLNSRLSDLIDGPLHTCHDECPQKACVLGRQLAKTEAKLAKAVEALREVVRNSHDIIAKKRCSQTLAEIEDL